MPPTLLISDWIGKLKGGSSHFINQEIAIRKILAWQGGYGVVTFGTKDLPWVINYVANQRDRHASGKTFDRLEWTEPVEDEAPEEDGQAC